MRMFSTTRYKKMKTKSTVVDPVDLLTSSHDLAVQEGWGTPT